jgi:hypothetical protein
MPIACSGLVCSGRTEDRPLIEQPDMAAATARNREERDIQFKTLQLLNAKPRRWRAAEGTSVLNEFRHALGKPLKNTLELFLGVWHRSSPQSTAIVRRRAAIECGDYSMGWGTSEADA